MLCSKRLYDENIMIVFTPTDSEKNICAVAAYQIYHGRMFICANKY